MRLPIFPVTFIGLALTGLFFSFRTGVADNPPAANDSTVIAGIFREALVNGKAYMNLAGLCQKAPKRLSGSPGAQVAVEFMQRVMLESGFDRVWLQPCLVPHWERGEPEQGYIIRNNEAGQGYRVNLCALGGSVATPADGITAEIVEVESYAELDKLGKKGITGKIVFYNHKFDESQISTFSAYGKAVQYRWQGPAAAEKYGAVGVLVRSVTSSIDTFPHTGVMRSDSLAAKIPAAAISTYDAEELHRMIQKDKSVRFRLVMNCRWFPDVLSYNVCGEIRGSVYPEQVILVGGHLDAWDLGEGAHDDGAGCVHAIEAVRLFKALGIRPRYTIRAVCFMNEENGGRGGQAYADSATVKNEKHIAAIESDAGGFSPRGFSTEMEPGQKKKIRSWQPLLLPYGIYDFSGTGGGADIGPLRKSGTALMGLEPEGARYFDYHHTEDDLFRHVNRRELHMGAAGMAAMVYLIDKYGL
ncbi:MAG TPA: M20/M25/M40 family metallo-hydrolase [Bacteroidia bacterium]|nr:M20/M25/M40 family metallo-hydrolase [Bacteroidia bacterium]